MTVMEDMQAPANLTDGRALYLDMVKKSLLNMIYGDKEVIYITPRNPVKRAIMVAAQACGMKIVIPKQFDPAKRLEGNDWPVQSQTLLNIKRLDNIQMCVETALADNVPGDLIETGVWRGGATILMRAVLKAYNARDRVVYVCDSFEGLPAPSKEYAMDADIPYHTWKALAVPMEEVQANFAVRFAGCAGEISERLVQGHAANRACQADCRDAIGRRHVRVHNGRAESAVSETLPRWVRDYRRVLSSGTLSAGGGGLSRAARHYRADYCH